MLYKLTRWLPLLLSIAGVCTLFWPWVYVNDDPYASSGFGLVTYLVHGEDNTYLLGKFPMGWFALLFPVTVAGAMIVNVWAAIKDIHVVRLICCVYIVLGLLVYLNVNNHLDNPHVDMSLLGFTIPHWGILSPLVIYALAGWDAAARLGLVRGPGWIGP